MPKSRLKTRANKRREQLIDERNMYGFKDLTPYRTVLRLREAEKERFEQNIIKRACEKHERT